MRLEGRIALITGAARGIGKAIATRFAREGASLFLCDRDLRALQDTASVLLAQGVRVGARPADVTCADTARAVVEATLGQFGRLDILVNNAGVATMGGLESVSIAEFDEVMDVDVRAVLRMMQAAVAPLAASGRGRVINVASIEGIRASAPLPVYCAAKHAVVGLTRATALELGRKGITVNALCPGPIETDMLRSQLSHEEARRRLIRHVPLGRIGRAEDVAGAAVFLAGDDAQFINGQMLIIDGGMSADVMGRAPA